MRLSTRFTLPSLARALLSSGFAICLACLFVTPAVAKGPKIHSAIVGKPHPVFWTTADAPATRLSLLIRPVIVDGRRKAWAIGETHDVTDHSFVVLEVQHVNDSLPGEKIPHFIWETASWLLIERNTGHVSVLHFTGYDPAISGISWFRDYAAFCTISANGKSLSAEVVQLGSRKPVAHKRIGSWPLKDSAPLLDPPVPADAAAPAALPGAADAASAPGANLATPNSDATAAQTAKLDPPISPKPTPLAPPAVHPHPVHPPVSVAANSAALNSGAPKPSVCIAVDWARDPLRATLTPRTGAAPIPLDLSLSEAASTTATEPAQ
jgi:hypothetical protein